MVGNPGWTDGRRHGRLNHSYVPSRLRRQAPDFVGGDKKSYRKVSNTRRTPVGNKIVDHSDVVGASPVGAAPTTSSFST